jgi:polyferredoxin
MKIKAAIHPKISYLFLAILFVLMCAFKFWFSAFLFIALGVVLTAVTGRKNFCNGICPLGTLQTLSSDENYTEKKQFSYQKPIAIGVSILFWGFAAVTALIFYRQPHFLWQLMLNLILAATASAMILQRYFGRRVWCSRLCPGGKLMSGTIKIRRIMIPGIRKEITLKKVK